jgi:DeoR/GlpR family transcriptional regulator of sugar metabolism
LIPDLLVCVCYLAWLTAVTASPMTAITLSEFKGIKVILAGGQLNRAMMPVQTTSMHQRNRSSIW